MTREEARKMAKIMLAYADGKNIQFTLRKIEDWQSCEEPIFNFSNYDYRVELKYRPFKNAEECLCEMEQHKCGGYVKYDNTYLCINALYRSGAIIDNAYRPYSELMNMITFTDGTPFGTKREEE